MLRVGFSIHPPLTSCIYMSFVPCDSQELFDLAVLTFEDSWKTLSAPLQLQLQLPSPAAPSSYPNSNNSNNDNSGNNNGGNSNMGKYPGGAQCLSQCLSKTYGTLHEIVHKVSSINS